MNLTPADLQAIEGIVRRVVSELVRSTPPPWGILPFRLTVRQFACAIQRCEETVRVEIRARQIKAKGRPYLIHPRELARFDVDPELALGRLREAGLLPPEAPR